MQTTTPTLPSNVNDSGQPQPTAIVDADPNAAKAIGPPPLVVARPEGLYCAAGDFFIDPWRPVSKAVITHAHADHARTGSTQYVAAAPGEGVLRTRLGAIDLHAMPYGQTLGINGVTLSFHPQVTCWVRLK